MAKEGHGPTRGPGRALHWLGQGICPECKGQIRPAGNSSYACLKCDRTYPVGRVP